MGIYTKMIAFRFSNLVAIATSSSLLALDIYSGNEYLAIRKFLPVASKEVAEIYQSVAIAYHPQPKQSCKPQKHLATNGQFGISIKSVNCGGQNAERI